MREGLWGFWVLAELRFVCSTGHSYSLVTGTAVAKFWLSRACMQLSELRGAVVFNCWRVGLIAVSGLCML